MKALAYLSSALILATIACASPPTPEATPVAAPSAEVVAPETPIVIVKSPIAENCYTASTEPRKIDTIVVHYTSAIYWFNKDFQKIVGPEGKAYAESIKLTPETLPEHKYDWQLNKAIFTAYKVSSHYMIDRDGTIVRLVDDNNVAWHAGKSKMPTDGREGVNGFSIGIELTASHPADDPSVKTPEDAYTAAQYESLNKLIAHLCKEHPITAVVGHDEIAPGRKTDPGPLFQWEKVRTPDYKPLVDNK